MPKDRLSFIHISDTHLGPDGHYVLWGKNTFACTQALVNLITDFHAPYDFIVHTGDVLNVASAESFEQAWKVFSRLQAPLFFVQGNHDGDTAFFKDHVDPYHTALHPFERDDTSSWWFIQKGTAFCCLDCRGPAFEDCQGVFTERHERILARFFTDSAGLPVVLFIHFPVLPLDSVWADTGMLLRNGGRLHELLLSCGRCIRGVFFGHVHNHITFVRNGIPYTGAPSPFCRFRLLPEDAEAVFEPDVPPAFNYVTVTDTSVIVKEISPGGRYGKTDAEY
jgi:Icc protein